MTRGKVAAVEGNCNVCGGVPSWSQTIVPYGWQRAHTSYTCDDHLSYLHGHVWTSTVDGEHFDGGHPGTSCICGGVYGACGCPSEPIAKASLEHAAVHDGPIVRIAP